MGRKLKKVKKQILFCLILAILFIKSTDVQAKEFTEKKFSQEEQAYIAQKKVLKTAIINNWQPLSATEGTNGNSRGLAADILGRFEQETGITIEYMEAANYREAVGMVEAGQADLAAVMVGYETFEGTNRLELTEPYLNAQMLLLHNKDVDISDLEQYDMAEVAGYPPFSNNPRISHLVFATPKDCILAVRSGHADLMYCDIFTGMSYLSRYENRDLVSTPINTEMQFSFGISPEESPVLKELLNQTIRQMSRGDINKSLTYNRMPETYSLGDFVYYYPFEIIIISLVIGFMIVAAYINYVRIKNRHSIAQQGYVKSYCLLADTFGEVGMEYSYIEDRMQLFGKNADKLSMPSQIEGFSSYLETGEKGISLTRRQFEKMLEDGMYGKAYDIELKCRLQDGKWQHFRLIFSVTATNESYERPVSMVGCLMNIEEQYREKKRLLHLGMKDALTGLFNRAGVEAEIGKHLKSGENIGEDVLLVMDVDYFKNFNDTYGHACGDDVLVKVSDVIKKTFRKEDIFCRWGGDEFLLYLVGAARHINLVEEKCSILQETMKKYQFEGKEIPVTLSIGGAVVSENSLEETFQKADKALYIVKKKGRDSLHIELE